MNKRKILLIPAGLLFFIILIFTFSDYETSKFLFVLRHLLVFLFIGYFVVYSQIEIRKFLLKKYNNRNTLISTTTGVFGALLLVIISMFQLNIVENSLLPGIAGCDYYDQNNNIIYVSKTASCPVVTGYVEDVNQMDFFSGPNLYHIELYEEDDTKYYTSIDIEYRNEQIVYYEMSTFTLSESSISGETIHELNRFTQHASITDGEIVVEQFFYQSADNNINENNYKDFEMASISNERIYTASFSDEHTSRIGAREYEVTVEDFKDSSLKKLASGWISIGTVDYEVYLNNQPTNVFFEYSIGSITARSDLLPMQSPGDHATFYYLNINFDPLNRRVLTSVAEYDLGNFQSTEDETRVYPVKDNYQSEKYIFEPIEYNQYFMYIKKTNRTRLSNNTERDEPWDRDFGYEINFEQRFTDLSDVHQYLFNRNNPLINYTFEKIREDERNED